MDTPRTPPAKRTRSGRPGSFLGLGGVAGFVALIIYAMAARQHRTQSQKSSAEVTDRSGAR